MIGVVLIVVFDHIKVDLLLFFILDYNLLCFLYYLLEVALHIAFRIQVLLEVKFRKDEFFSWGD